MGDRIHLRMSEESRGIAAAFREHRLFRIASVYAIAGWIAIQVADIILETFESPVWIMQGFLILVLAGFPATLTVFWLVDRTQRSRSAKSLVSIATIALASLISFAAYQYFSSLISLTVSRRFTTCFSHRSSAPQSWTFGYFRL